MPRTGSRSPGSRWKRQLRSSCNGPAMPMEITGSNPSSRRAMTVRLAQGHARATASRYRSGSTGQGEEPSAVMRSLTPNGSRTNSPLSLLMGAKVGAPGGVVESGVLSLRDLVRTGMRVALADGVGSPQVLHGPLSAAATAAGGVSLVAGWFPVPAPDLDVTAFAEVRAVAGG